MSEQTQLNTNQSFTPSQTWLKPRVNTRATPKEPMMETGLGVVTAIISRWPLFLSQF